MLLQISCSFFLFHLSPEKPVPRLLHLVGPILSAFPVLKFIDILEHFEPGPTRWPGLGLARARPSHEPYWAGVGRDLEARKIFLARARPEMLFLVVLHYKMCGRPAQAQARPEPSPKIKGRRVQWDGHGQNFFGPK
jgi:hypothetical protein